MKPQFLTNLGAKIQIFRLFLPLKIVNFDTKIKIDYFSSFSIICSFWTKNGPLTHCEEGLANVTSRNYEGSDALLLLGTLQGPNHLPLATVAAKLLQKARRHFVFFITNLILFGSVSLYRVLASCVKVNKAQGNECQTYY